jgi:hypothetical protein
VAALLSGLVATWVSILHRNRQQVRDTKIRVFQELLGNRYVLLPIAHEAAAAAAFNSAVNQIAVVFHDCDSVMNALRSFHETIVEPSTSADLKNKRLLELFKSLAKHLKVNTELLGENFFLQAFSVSQGIPQPVDFQFQGVRWQGGQPLIMGSLRFGASGPWTPIVLPSELAGFLGCTLIELVALGRERARDLGTTNLSIEIGAMGQEFIQRLDRRRAANAK